MGPGQPPAQSCGACPHHLLLLYRSPLNSVTNCQAHHASDQRMQWSVWPITESGLFGLSCQLSLPLAVFKWTSLQIGSLGWLPSSRCSHMFPLQPMLSWPRVCSAPGRQLCQHIRKLEILRLSCRAVVLHFNVRRQHNSSF